MERNDYSMSTIDHLIKANTKLFNDKKDLEKENKELKEKMEKIYNYISQEDKELSVDSYFKFKNLLEFEYIKLIINGEDYEEVEDILSII